MRRRDCLLSLVEIDWLADRILDTPDLFIVELRRVFVHFHPGKSHVSEYCIAQGLMVCDYGSNFLFLFFFFLSFSRISPPFSL